MTVISDTMLSYFYEQGFVVVPGVLNGRQIAAAREVVAELLDAEPFADGHVGPHFLWPHFDSESHPLLKLYRQSGIEDLAAQLLRTELSVSEPESAQVAATIPPWLHQPGRPHADGLTPSEPDGRPGTFSLLAGLWFTDHSRRNRGNLWVWPGTHLRFGRYLAERGPDALKRIDEMNPGPYPDIKLGEPTQVISPDGSVLFAHYLLAHNIGNYDSAAGEERRETVYYRLRASGHRERWQQVVAAPLTEFDTVGDP